MNTVFDSYYDTGIIVCSAIELKGKSEKIKAIFVFKRIYKRVLKLIEIYGKTNKKEINYIKRHLELLGFKVRIKGDISCLKKSSSAWEGILKYPNVLG